MAWRCEGGHAALIAAGSPGLGWLVARGRWAKGQIARRLVPVMGVALLLFGGGCSTAEFVRVDAQSLPREAELAVAPEVAERAVVVALMDSGFSASRHSNRPAITWACRPIPYTTRAHGHSHRHGPYYEAEVEVVPTANGSLVRLIMSSGFGGDPIEDGDMVDRRGVDLAWAFFAGLREAAATPSPESVAMVIEGGPDSVFEFDKPADEAIEELRRALVRHGYVVSLCNVDLGLVVADRGGYAPAFSWDYRTGGSTWTVTGLVRDTGRGSVVRIKTSDWHIETSVPGLADVLRKDMAGGV